jgi:hypothetical protein
VRNIDKLEVMKKLGCCQESFEGCRKFFTKLNLGDLRTDLMAL